MLRLQRCWQLREPLLLPLKKFMLNASFFGVHARGRRTSYPKLVRSEAPLRPLRVSSALAAGGHPSHRCQHVRDG